VAGKKVESQINPGPQPLGLCVHGTFKSYPQIPALQDNPVPQSEGPVHELPERVPHVPFSHISSAQSTSIAQLVPTVALHKAPVHVNPDAHWAELLQEAFRPETQTFDSHVAGETHCAFDAQDPPGCDIHVPFEHVNPLWHACVDEHVPPREDDEAGVGQVLRKTK
jgi:hypothetical protein